MPKNQVSDLITDQEIAFAHLVLSGTMTDRRAAEAVSLNPDTAAHTKAKPCVRDYMLEHRAPMHERLLQQETEEVRRLNLGREQVLARLWEIANLGPEMTRNSMSAQIKALSMIVAIEGLIPSGITNGRRAGSPHDKPAPPLVHPQIDAAAWLRQQQGQTTGPQPSPDPGPDIDSSEFILTSPFSPAETTPSAPHAPVAASAPETRVPSPFEKTPDTWRLRL
jgi:hypothetical protein